MRSYLVSFLLSAVVACFLTPFVRMVAFKIGAIDAPDFRRVNTRPMCRLGGIAILVGFVAPLFGLLVYENDVSALFVADISRVIGLLGGAFMMAAVGFYDDCRGIRALHKLLSQIFVAIFAFAMGFRIEEVLLPLFGPLDMGVFALPVTVFWIVGIINAVNLIDGLDGLAAGVAFFTCIVSFVVGLLSGSILTALLSASLGGALLGFLLHNFNPASIFMGDTGSLCIGYVLSVMSLLGSAAKSTTAISLLVPILALGLPIMDTLVAILRRSLEKRPIFSPDRGHIHHRLLDLGLTQKRAVLTLYGASLVFTISAIFVYFGRAWQVGLALLISTIMMILLVRFLGLFNLKRAQNKSETKLENIYLNTNVIRANFPVFYLELHNASNRNTILEILRNFGRSLGGEVLFLEKTEPLRNEETTDQIFFPVKLTNSDMSKILFKWPSKNVSLDSQEEIVLQLFVDAVEKKLIEEEKANELTEEKRKRSGTHHPLESLTEVRTVASSAKR